MGGAVQSAAKLSQRWELWLEILLKALIRQLII